MGIRFRPGLFKMPPRPLELWRNGRSKRASPSSATLLGSVPYELRDARTPPSSPKSPEEIWDEGVSRVQERKRSREASSLVEGMPPVRANRMSDNTIVNFIASYQSDGYASPPLPGYSSPFNGLSPVAFDFGFQDQPTRPDSPTLVDDRPSLSAVCHGTTQISSRSMLPAPLEHCYPVESTQSHQMSPARRQLPSSMNGIQLSVPLWSAILSARPRPAPAPPVSASPTNPKSTQTPIHVPRKPVPAPSSKNGSPSQQTPPGSARSGSTLVNPSSQVYDASKALQNTVSFFDDDDEKSNLIERFKAGFSTRKKRTRDVKVKQKKRQSRWKRWCCPCLESRK